MRKSKLNREQIPWRKRGKNLAEKRQKSGKALALSRVIGRQNSGKKLDFSKGIKFDTEKILADLVLGDFARALVEVSKVGTFGAKKYSAHNWLKVEGGVDRYSSAMLRHYLSEKTEGAKDKETGLLHAAHLAWNALARLELMLKGKT